MTQSASWALQKGIYQKLAADTTLTELMGGVHIYDDVPQGTAYPYLTLGQSVVRDWSTATEKGQEHVLTLHVWSSAAGRKQAKQIIQAIDEALHDVDLVLEDHSLVNLRFEFADARREPSGEVYHGIIRYRAVTELAA
jgi:hypothetical protein